MPANISVDDDIVPGGDIRVRGNAWLRSAFKATGLGKIPRETQFRLAVGKLMAKKKIGSQAVKLFFLSICGLFHHLNIKTHSKEDQQQLPKKT